MMDFELANIKAAFPRAEIRLCLFHFTQSLFGRMWFYSDSEENTKS